MKENEDSSQLIVVVFETMFDSDRQAATVVFKRA